MQKLFIILAIFLYFLLKDVSQVQTAAIICSESTTSEDGASHKVNANNSTEEQYDLNNNNNNNDNSKEGNKNTLNRIFHNIQCTLEKAKPWMAELQQEAKRLEEAAKLLGLGILNSFGEFVDKLVEETADTPTKLQDNSTFGAENSITSTESVAEEISQYLCPEGFIADHNGICERVDY